MKDSRTQPAELPSSLKVRDIRLTVPTSADALTQHQLRYVYTLMGMFDDLNIIKSYMFFRFAGITIHRRSHDGWKLSVKQGRKTVVFFLNAEQIAGMLDTLSYVDGFETMNNRLDTVCKGKYHAVPLLLEGVDFVDYMNAEKYFQAYLRTKENGYLTKLARLLYRDKQGNKVDGIKPDGAELIGTFMWFSYVKTQYNVLFPHFFRKVNDDEDVDDISILDTMNAEIRALTGGDITKESKVLHMPCRRALTELDAKAREAQEMQRIMEKNKHA